MFDATTNRADRRTAVRVKATAAAGVAAAAMTLGMAVAPGGALPAAHAADINIDWDPTYTSGLLAGLLDAVGVDQFSISAPLGSNTANLTLFFDNINSSTKNLYNTIAAIPQPSCSSRYATSCRYALMLATSQATPNMVDAYRAQIQSVTTGTTPAGLIPFTAAQGSTSDKPTQTNQVLILLQNPMRPNGGILSRFPGLAKVIGEDPTMPAAGKVTSPDGTIALNTTTVDTTWAYDPIGDYPEVFNVFALANTAWAGLPLNLVTGGLKEAVISDGQGNTVSQTAIGLNIAGVLQAAGPLVPMTDGKAFYITLVPNQLPILTPMRLPTFAVNAVLNALNAPFTFGNPVADALEPALKILVNIGYDDVVVTRDPTTGVASYDRTFLTGGVPTKFGSVDPLTPEERKAVPGDVWNALVSGVQAQFDKPYWGVIVPKTPPASGATTPAPNPAAVKAAAATPVVPVVDATSAEQEAPPSVPAVPTDPAAAPIPVPDLPEVVDAVPAPRSSRVPVTVGDSAAVTRGRGQTASSDHSGHSDTSKPDADSGRHRAAD